MDRRVDLDHRWQLRKAVTKTGLAFSEDVEAKTIVVESRASIFQIMGGNE